MKQLLVIAFIAISHVVFAQSSPVEFNTMKYSFGKIPQGKPVTTTFTFTNTSSKPVIIETATAECGCTTPDYPKTPVMKGKEATIKVTYNAANAGDFKKNVTVKFANVPEPVVLEIDGTVIPKQVPSLILESVEIYGTFQFWDALYFYTFLFAIN